MNTICTIALVALVLVLGLKYLMFRLTLMNCEYSYDEFKELYRIFCNNDQEDFYAECYERYKQILEENERYENMEE